MSDLSDLQGIYPTSLRWNAEAGFLAISVFNAEHGERELEEIELGQPATFVFDLLTRERGYAKVKIGIYDARLTPVGSPPPPWPGDDEFKACVGIWAWSPNYGEVRIETNATLFRQTIASIWDQCRLEPRAVQGLQPVVRFIGRSSVFVKAVNKSFYSPRLQIVGWCARDQVPGWADRPVTVPPPTALPALAASPASAPVAPGKKPAKARQGAAAQPGTRDRLEDLLDDEIPDFGAAD
jgi:hypothetical protein